MPPHASSNQAVKTVFQGYASVQLQGSTAKGTGVQGPSDWDMFVRLHGTTISTVTKQQRLQVQ